MSHKWGRQWDDYEISLKKMELRFGSEKVAAMAEDMRRNQDRRDLREARQRIAALETRIAEADAPPPGPAKPEVVVIRKTPPRITLS